MKYVVLLEKHDGIYTATVPALPGCRSQGITEEEALDNIRAAIADTLARVIVATVEVTAPPNRLRDHPWAKFAGMWKDDLTFDDCKRSPLKTRSAIASSAATKPSHAP